MKPLLPYDAVKAPRKPPAKQERFPKNAIPELREWIRQQPCILALPRQVSPCVEVSPCRGLVEVAHVKSRGSGGPDWDNVIPLCMEHHREQHRLGRASFEFKRGIRLAPVAKLMTAAFLKWKGEKKSQLAKNER